MGWDEELHTELEPRAIGDAQAPTIRRAPAGEPRGRAEASLPLRISGAGTGPRVPPYQQRQGEPRAETPPTSS